MNARAFLVIPAVLAAGVWLDAARPGSNPVPPRDPRQVRMPSTDVCHASA